MDYEYCKFGEFCYFSHKNKINIESTEVKEFKTKILPMENAAKEKDNLIKALEIEMKIQEKKIDDINKNIITSIENEKSSLESRINTLEEKVDENIKEFENKLSKDESNPDLNDDKIKTTERRLYILEKRRLGSDFCDYCDEEFKLGSEKDRKEKIFISEITLLLSVMCVNSDLKTEKI